MKNRTNSDMIRDSLLSTINTISFIIGLSGSSNKNDLRSALNSSLYENFVDKDDVPDSLVKLFIDEESLKLTHVVRALQQVILLSDYYIVSTYKYKTQNEDEKDPNIENALKSIREKSFGYITKSLDLLTMAKAIEEIRNANFYKKIVMFNSLDDTDIEFLSSINPFFEEEYNLYGIQVTPEFVAKEINEQQGTNLPNEAIYKEIARLVADLYRVDEDLVNEIVFDMIETLNINGDDINRLMDILNSDCASDIDEVFASLVQQYYNIKKDKKRYEK